MSSRKISAKKMGYNIVLCSIWRCWSFALGSRVACWWSRCV